MKYSEALTSLVIKDASSYLAIQLFGYKLFGIVTLQKVGPFLHRFFNNSTWIFRDFTQFL